MKTVTSRLVPQGTKALIVADSSIASHVDLSGSPKLTKLSGDLVEHGANR
jgi:hypothetical protein